MNKDKNLTPETEVEEIKAPKINIKSIFAKKERKAKIKRIKNQALLRKGGFSVAITAAVLAGIIVLNILVGALSSRFVLEFDMSVEKQNSINEDNIKFIKNVDDEIEIILCAKADEYVGGYMTQYAQKYKVTEDASDYYKQTIKLLDKYSAYNKKIDVRYMDTQSTEFTEITTKYSSNSQINYGDIIVVNKSGNNNRYKVVGYEDIYLLNEDTTYASYGYTTFDVVANNVETAVTSAISYVTSEKSKKALIITGHSKADYTASYQKVLKENNYEITVMADKLIGNISDEYDAVIIPAPTTDFLESELNSLSAFLDNNGKLGKGLIFIANATAPYLPNFYEFMSQWGIAIDEGILFETDSSYHLPDDPTTLVSFVQTSEDTITNGMTHCITGLNLPMTPAFEQEGSITVSSLMSTPETVVAAPAGTAAGWTDADNYTKQSYSTAIQSKSYTYDDDNNEIASYVYALSSIEFIESTYSEQNSVSNKNLYFAITERASGAEDTGISFISKTITDESFSDKVTEASTNVVSAIFMFILPIVCIAVGIYIFIRRKNA